MGYTPVVYVYAHAHYVYAHCRTFYIRLHVDLRCVVCCSGYDLVYTVVALPGCYAFTFAFTLILRAFTFTRFAVLVCQVCTRVLVHVGLPAVCVCVVRVHVLLIWLVAVTLIRLRSVGYAFVTVTLILFTLVTVTAPVGYVPVRYVSLARCPFTVTFTTAHLLLVDLHLRLVVTLRTRYVYALPSRLIRLFYVGCVPVCSHPARWLRYTFGFGLRLLLVGCARLQLRLPHVISRIAVYRLRLFAFGLVCLICPVPRCVYVCYVTLRFPARLLRLIGYVGLPLRYVLRFTFDCAVTHTFSLRIHADSWFAHWLIYVGCPVTLPLSRSRLPLTLRTTRCRTQLRVTTFVWLRLLHVIHVCARWIFGYGLPVVRLRVPTFTPFCRLPGLPRLLRCYRCRFTVTFCTVTVAVPVCYTARVYTHPILFDCTRLRLRLRSRTRLPRLITFDCRFTFTHYLFYVCYGLRCYVALRCPLCITFTRLLRFVTVAVAFTPHV